jgi:hypothetical protein
MTAFDLLDSILFALDADERTTLEIGIALKIIFDNLPDANFDGGMQLRDLSDVRCYLLDMHIAAKERAKRKARVSA